MIHREAAGLRRGPGTITSFLLYVAIAWVLFEPLGWLDRSRLPGCACGDQASQVWFIAYGRYVWAHGLQLHPSLMNYPHGFNLFDNASMLLLGMIAAPVTAHWGPVAAYDLLARIGLIVSALTVCFILRRLLGGWVIPVLAGAAFEVSPYLTHQASQHVFLTFDVLPLLVLYLVYRQFAERQQRFLAAGCIIGLLLALQFFIDSEFVVTTVGLSVLVGAVCCIRNRPAGRDLSRFAAGVTLVAAPLLGYPAWYAVAGPGHISGATQLATSPGLDLLGSIYPVDNQLIAGHVIPLHGPSLTFLGDMGFIGIPLLLLAFYGARVGSGQTWVRPTVYLAESSWILSLGPHLVVLGHLTKLPLPFCLLAQLPVTQDVIPSRLSMFTDFAIVLLAAQAMRALIEKFSNRGRLRQLSVAAVGLVAVGYAAPATSYAAVSVGAAADFRHGPIVDAIPGHGVVLTYPVANFFDDQAAIWQAEAALKFSLIGGYVIHPTADGTQTRRPDLLPPAAVESVLERTPASTNPNSRDVQAARRALPRFVLRYGVTDIVVDTNFTGAAVASKAITRVYGPPIRFGAIDLWQTRATR